MSGTTKKYSVTLPEDLAEDARSRSGGSGLSAYVTNAVRRQVQRDQLAELVGTLEAENGPVTDQRMSEIRDEMRRALREQGVSASDSAQKEKENEAA
ncbi:hypothetical protein ABZ635_11195 [Nocardiopsis sp. NPDC007018]|uniref:hypothetical protein n=1 Tax=Nocardiopsis sp. NPDC007018 TaxID=3155721 RepID=UPI0033F19242